MKRDDKTPHSADTDRVEQTVIGDGPLTLDALATVATGRSRPHLSQAARTRMAATAAFVAKAMGEGPAIYGVTTGVGASVVNTVAPERAAELSLNLLRFHGCGTGMFLTQDTAAAVLTTRLASLSRGASGVRPIVADRLITLLDGRVLPCIPEEGSVGASGDLTPLSYVAAVLVGEREVFFRGEIVPATSALRVLGVEALTLGPKEALALMNGTSVATAIGALAWIRARRIARLSAAISALASEAIVGNPAHFDAFLHGLKPHPGQVQAARWISDDLGLGLPGTKRPAPARLQDRYSIRCAPHVIGVLVDSLTWSEQLLETEINGVNDNPVVDLERGIIVHGGNFYGGHIAQAMDTLKTAVANIADLHDRQLQLLSSPRESGGLPENLVGVTGHEATTHHGFKAMGITASALAAEALKLTMPASAFSRSTELHNQDKVPMATLAARDLRRIVELTEQVCAIGLIAACQALDLRVDATPGHVLGPRAQALVDAVRAHVPRVGPDRRMDHDIRTVLALLREGTLPIGEEALQ
ncbi:MAG: histidine ammonia-lyase [Myxococcota bacterium]|jgi:histidine ammonia-lyase